MKYIDGNYDIMKELVQNMRQEGFEDGVPNYRAAL